MCHRDRQQLESSEKIIPIRDQVGDAVPCSLGEERLDGCAVPADIMLKKMIDCINPSQRQPASQPSLASHG
jgi:hypothetical protein